MHKQIWVGLAELKANPDADIFGGSKGAYVHVMAWAEDSDEFLKVLGRSVKQLKCELIEVRDAQPWAVRDSGVIDTPKELLDMVASIEHDVTKVAFGTFHAWLKDERAHQS